MHGEEAKKLEALIEARIGHYRQPGWQQAFRAALNARAWPADGAALARLSGELQDSPLAGAAWQEILGSIAIGETRFLRDRRWFRQIERLVLRPLIQQRRDAGYLHIRIWSAGCSTGEEPYTLAFLLRDMLPDAKHWTISILATDLRQDALRFAEQAVYERSRLRELSPEQIGRHFTPVAGRKFAVASELRQMVKFMPLNLTDTAECESIAGGGYDLILCRNVLIYLRPDQQRQLGARLAKAVSRSGWLVVSPAEAMNEWYAPLQPVNTAEAILFRHPVQGHKPHRLAEPAADNGECTGPAINVPQVPAFMSLQPEPQAEQPEPPALESQDELARLRDVANGGDLVKARQACQALLKQDAANEHVCILLAEICLEQQDWDAAKRVARHAIYLNPHSALAHFLLASALRRGGKPELARRAMNVAVELAGGTGDGSAPILPQSELMLQHIHQAARLFLSGKIATDSRDD